MPSNFEIQIADGNLLLDVEIAPPEQIGIDLSESTPTFNALTGPGLKGEPGEDGVDGSVGERGPKGEPGNSYPLFVETLSNEFQDGVNVSFAFTNETYSPSSVQVFRNGLKEIYGLGYSATTTHVTFTTAPLDSDIIEVIYQIVQ